MQYLWQPRVIFSSESTADGAQGNYINPGHTGGSLTEQSPIVLSSLRRTPTMYFTKTLFVVAFAALAAAVALPDPGRGGYNGPIEGDVDKRYTVSPTRSRFTVC